MRQASFRAMILLLCMCSAALTALWIGGPSSPDGLLLDLLIAARARLLGPTPSTSPAPVAVIALDRRSLASPELAPYPRTFLAPFWATLLDHVFMAGARAVGFDFLFAYTANRFVPNFDAPFLAALGQYRERVVLARSSTTLPAPPFLAALRHAPASLGFIELIPDSDGRQRHVYATYPTEDEAIPGIASTLLQRAQAPPMPRVVLLAPRRHLETQIPTYALIDVWRCAQQAPQTLKLAFAETIILIGSTLPDEDRWVSSGRFLPPQVTSAPPIHPCGLRRLGASVPHAESVPGVFLQAAAVEAVLRGQATTTAPVTTLIAVTTLTAATGTVLGFSLAPWLTLVAIGGMVLLCLCIAVLLLHYDLWLPLALPLGMLLGTAALAYVMRYLMEERQRQQLQHAFGHYLAPALVARLARDRSALTLGGERREITVMFADLSGFTALSGQIDAAELMRATNQYLGYIVEQVEATGGYVDKFMGDAVLALWGAPATDTQHALHGVQAAMAAGARISAAYQEALAQHTTGFAVKIGLHSGRVMVGNVGTKGRYNYTAVGETVNVASRLGSVPEFYACQIVLGPTTAAFVQDAFLLCELDTIRVKGRATPLRIFMPLAAQAAATAPQYAYARDFALALAHYRAGNFSAAAALWEQLPPLQQHSGPQPGDNTPAHPARCMAQRARAYAVQPPPQPWDGVWDFQSK